jgi:penicillin-binding protein 1C
VKEHPSAPIRRKPHIGFQRRYVNRLFYACLVVLGLASSAYYIVPFAFPIPNAILSGPGDSVMLLDRHGKPLSHWVRPDYYRHRATNLDILPADLIHATLAAEDKRFYQHGGIDFRATARALRDSWQLKRFVSGASTVTQQTVKITSKKSSRTFRTKIRECLTARHVEMTLNKKDILTAYFNHLDYGNRSQGPLQAARHYFGKPLGQLSLAECALLAGLPQAPSRLNPRRHPERAIKRRNWILDRMGIVYGVPPERIALAKSEPLKLSTRSPSSYAPHLTRLMRQARAHSKPGTPPRDIRTTLSAPLQREITELVRTQLRQLTKKNIHHAAVVVIDNHSGEILAHVGSPWFSFNLKNGGQIDATRVPRSPGSALKPFTYLLAFEKAGMTPATIVPDIPTQFADARGTKTFVNYERHYKGPVTIHHALANSLNVPAVRTLNAIGGPAPLLAKLKQFGITTLTEKPEHYGLGLTLGSGEVTLIELANAYATLARMGRFLSVTFFPEKTHPNSMPLPNNIACWMIANTLSDNAARTAAFGPHSHLNLPFRCAVKTGTSTDFRDNWCLGFTADYTVGVWTGNLDNSPMRGISGVSGAGPIFHATMMLLHQHHTPNWYPAPKGMTLCHIHTQTGKRLPTATQDTITLLLPNSHLPLPQTPADYNADGRICLDARYSEWLKTEGDQARFAIMNTPSVRPDTIAPLHILSPSREATYLLDPDLPGQGKMLELKTDFPGKINWSSPTLKITTENGTPTATLTPGTHQIILKDQSGRSTTRSIKVEDL